ncbi:MAG: 30S ribosomal protein S1 [Candidatus Margulisiibacteriota bacterium]
MTQEFEATHIEPPKSEAEEGDVEALIQGAIKELEQTKAAKPAEEKIKVESFTATPITPAAKPAPAAPEKKAEPVKPKAEPKKEAPKEPESPYAQTFKEYKQGDIITGKVARVDQSSVLVDIGYKADGIITNDEIRSSDQLKVGDTIKVYIDNLENKEGYVELSKKKADFEAGWHLANEAFKSKKLLQAKVTSAVRGGLVVECEGIHGFVPASQVSRKPGTELESLKGQTIPVKVIEVNRRQGKVIMSNRSAAGEKEREDAKKLINELEVGQTRRGKVSSLKNFGAFVDLGGIEGLVHLSELSWKRVKNPGDVLKVGQELDVFVLGVDKVNNKIALGLKELQPDPWETMKEKYKPGAIVKGRVARLVKFGAFVELDEYLEGLVHISELSTRSVRNPEDAVKPGDEVEVKILRVLPDEQKIGLSIKEALLDKERKQVQEKQAEASKITIGDIIAEKQRQKAETEEDEEQVEGKPDTNEVPSEA